MLACRYIPEQDYWPVLDLNPALLLLSAVLRHAIRRRGTGGALAGG